MSDQQDEHERRGSLRKWVAFFVALPVLYVLSMGPIWYTYNMGWISNETRLWLMQGPYRPIWLVVSSLGDTWATNAYYDYIDWWCDLTK